MNLMSKRRGPSPRSRALAYLISVEGRTVRAVLDSGAQLSHADPEIATKHSPVGVVEDFYPVLGRFETRVYQRQSPRVTSHSPRDRFPPGHVTRWNRSSSSLARRVRAVWSASGKEGST